MSKSSAKVVPIRPKSKKPARGLSPKERAAVDAANDVYWAEKEFQDALLSLGEANHHSENARTAVIFAGATEMLAREIGDKLVTLLGLARGASKATESVRLNGQDTQDTASVRERRTLSRLESTIRRYRDVRDEYVKTRIPEHRGETPESLRGVLRRIERDEKRIKAIRKRVEGNWKIVQAERAAAKAKKPKAAKKAASK